MVPHLLRVNHDISKDFSLHPTQVFNIKKTRKLFGKKEEDVSSSFFPSNFLILLIRLYDFTFSDDIIIILYHSKYCDDIIIFFLSLHTK